MEQINFIAWHHLVFITYPVGDFFTFFIHIIGSDQALVDEIDIAFHGALFQKNLSLLQGLYRGMLQEMKNIFWIQFIDKWEEVTQLVDVDHDTKFKKIYYCLGVLTSWFYCSIE